MIDKQGFLPTFSLVNVQNFIRLKLMGTHFVHGRGRRSIFRPLLVSALHRLIHRTQLHQIDLPFPRRQRIAHTDPSWQSTKTGYYLDQFYGDASCCLDMYATSLAGTEFKAILTHRTSIDLLFRWPQAAVHLPIPRCRQPHRAHFSFVTKHKDRVLPDVHTNITNSTGMLPAVSIDRAATDNMTDFGRNRRFRFVLMTLPVIRDKLRRRTYPTSVDSGKEENNKQQDDRRQK